MTLYTYVSDARDERYSRPLPNGDAPYFVLLETDVPPQEIQIRRLMAAVGVFEGIKRGFSFAHRLFGGSEEYRENEKRLDAALAELLSVARSTPEHTAALRRVLNAELERGTSLCHSLANLAEKA
ncbi:hypothetical protein BJG93_34780 (plasmid) [Paraburkholderia sprentiae WSM5005]|uniref:Uncharacterized protein n=1 Tax=Paraburkholderia sprentiae WSM5005 TaxID=754502 RepID=A0ACA8AX50_9BURK|nr:hypothetical protein [Paraburkholderia sprentiae]APA90280.1 hypothetical protein BJG93_34780 [Paraburkholderia sprentiae WSM5005]